MAFYERMGFVRVGAAAKYSTVIPGTETPPLDGLKPAAEAEVSSDFEWYHVKTTGETPNTIAKQHCVDPFDVVFLNQAEHAAMTGTTECQPGERLRVPRAPPPSSLAQQLKTKNGKHSKNEHRQNNVWYRVTKTETPKTIAAKLNCSVSSLVSLNRVKYKELVSTSRLSAGVKLRIPRADAIEAPLAGFVPYRHWTSTHEANIEKALPYQWQCAVYLVFGSIYLVTGNGIEKGHETNSKHFNMCHALFLFRCLSPKLCREKPF